MYNLINVAQRCEREGVCFSQLASKDWLAANSEEAGEHYSMMPLRRRRRRRRVRKTTSTNLKGPWPYDKKFPPPKKVPRKLALDYIGAIKV